MPSLLSRERTPSVIVADISHDSRMSATNASTSDKARFATIFFILQLLILVGFQILQVDDVQLEGAHHEPCGIDTPAIGEQLLKDYAAKCSDIANMDKNPKLEGRNMSMFLSPKQK